MNLNESVQLYMAIWIFWSEKQQQYFYTEPILTPYLNYDWLSKDKLHLMRAIKSFGDNQLTLTNQFHCFDGNKINDSKNCVRGIIYVKHVGESNLNEKEYKQGFTDTPPQPLTPKEENPFKEDHEIKESFTVSQIREEATTEVNGSVLLTHSKSPLTTKTHDNTATTSFNWEGEF